MTNKFYFCPSCQERNKFSSLATDRVELEKDKGERIAVECAHCHARTNLNVNKIQAEPNNVITGASGVLGLICAGLFLNMGFIAGLPLALPVVVHQAQARAASSFNRYKIKETK